MRAPARSVTCPLQRNGVVCSIAELTTNKAVLGVLGMLLVLPMLEPVTPADHTPAFRLANLKRACNTSASPAEPFLFQSDAFQEVATSFVETYGSSVLRLQVGGIDVFPPNEAVIAERRNLELRWEEAAGGGTATAVVAAALFDDRAEARHLAELSLLTTILVVFVLLGGACGFGRDSKAFAARITAPLAALCTDMQSVAEVEFLPSKADTTHGVLEVQLVQASFTSMKAAIEAFAKYVPRQVVRQLTTSVAAPPELGVVKRTMSYLFCDIEGFTTVCEEMLSCPERLLAFLSEFFKEMATVVAETDGTLIEYIGDAILACWNNGLTEQQQRLVGDADDDEGEAKPEHGKNALMASWKMRQRLKELAPRWRALGYPAVKLRTGVHSGPAFVGYIGAPQRMKYGLLGPHVSAAMSLEEANKNYGTYGLLSHSLWSGMSPEAQESFVVRAVDVVVLAGVSAAEPIYELLGTRVGVTPAQSPGSAVAAGRMEDSSSAGRRSSDGGLVVLPGTVETAGPATAVARARRPSMHAGDVELQAVLTADRPPPAAAHSLLAEPAGIPPVGPTPAAAAAIAADAQALAAYGAQHTKAVQLAFVDPPQDPAARRVNFQQALAIVREQQQQRLANTAEEELVPVYVAGGGQRGDVAAAWLVQRLERCLESPPGPEWVGADDPDAS
eukprot:SAG22_NODE_1296_length_4822_cov_3.066271_2_plen_674_part_00